MMTLAIPDQPTMTLIDLVKQLKAAGFDMRLDTRTDQIDGKEHVVLRANRSGFDETISFWIDGGTFYDGPSEVEFRIEGYHPERSARAA